NARLVTCLRWYALFLSFPTVSRDPGKGWCFPEFTRAGLRLAYGQTPGRIGQFDVRSCGFHVNGVRPAVFQTRGGREIEPMFTSASLGIEEVLAKGVGRDGAE